LRFSQQAAEPARMSRHPAVLLFATTPRSRIPAAAKQSFADNFLQKQQKQRGS
jgi:hypothetical protein